MHNTDKSNNNPRHIKNHPTNRSKIQKIQHWNRKKKTQTTKRNRKPKVSRSRDLHNLNILISFDEPGATLTSPRRGWAAKGVAKWAYWRRYLFGGILGRLAGDSHASEWHLRISHLQKKCDRGPNRRVPTINNSLEGVAREGEGPDLLKR